MSRTRTDLAFAFIGIDFGVPVMPGFFPDVMSSSTQTTEYRGDAIQFNPAFSAVLAVESIPGRKHDLKCGFDFDSDPDFDLDFPALRCEV